MKEILCFGIKVIQSAKYDKMLAQPRQTAFDTSDQLHISVQEETFICLNDEDSEPSVSCKVELQRETYIQSDNPISSEILFTNFQDLEKLLMIFHGSFLNIQSITFYDENEQECTNSEQIEQFYISHRLKYYEMSDLFQGSYGELCDWSYTAFLNANTFSTWKDILSDLDILHQVVLYNCAATGVPTELTLAFIIEAFEPLIELITQKTGLFTSLKPGEKGTTLKMCLDTVISHYGQDIFLEEYNKDGDKFVQCLVNSRVRLMHIKRNYQKPYLSKMEAILYSWKLMLLYRRVLLELLGVNYETYVCRLKSSVKRYNFWQGVLENLLQKGYDTHA